MKKIITILVAFVLSLNIKGQSLVSVSPNSGVSGQTYTVIITGNNTHFTNSSTVAFGFTSTMNSLVALSSTSLQVNVTIPSGTLTNNYYVSVHDSIDGTIYLGSGFSVTGPLPIPPLIVTPSYGYRGQTLDVSVWGHNTQFTQYPNIFVYFAFTQTFASTCVNTMNITSDTTMLLNITISPTANTGCWGFYIFHNGAPQSSFDYLSDGFCVSLFSEIEDNVDALQSFKISPNPAISDITLSLPELKNANISITSITGSEVFNCNMQNTQNKSFDVTSLEEGVYFVTLKTEKGVTTKKFMKTN